MTVTPNCFQSLVENSPDAISLVNREGTFLYSSAASINLSGYRPDEMVGKSCTSLIHPEDLAQFTRSLQEVIAEPLVSRQWDARVRHLDGNYYWVEHSASNLLLDPDVSAVVMYQRNIHSRKAMEEENRMQAGELARANSRMEEFAYTVAHDLREPLRALSVYTRILLKNTPMDANATELADFVFGGFNRMSALITDLLSFAVTGRQGPVQPVDLQHAAAQALENLSLEIAESGAVVTVDSLPCVLANETHLVRLFQNLISNALKYRRRCPVKILVSAEPYRSDWLLKIQDNGLGIAPEYQSRIFLPFIRLANRDVPGTGLGLAVCKKIVEGSGGTIWVDSELGVGSTFAFTLLSGAGISGNGFAAAQGAA